MLQNVHLWTSAKPSAFSYTQVHLSQSASLTERVQLFLTLGCPYCLEVSYHLLGASIF